MKKIATSLFAAMVLGVFTLSACGGGGGGDKCSQAVNKMMDWAMEEGKKEMAKLEGEEKKMAEAMMKGMKEAMKKEKEGMVKKCQEEVKKNKDAEKGLDCVLKAKNMEEAEKCEGLDGMKGGM